jgi:rod shape-determining protein MreC
MENKRLRLLLDFKEKTSFDLIPAEVVAQNPNRLLYSLVLNVGRNDHVSTNMPVVGIDGVVGKTVAVSPYISTVQLLSDPNCRISVLVQRSRVASILEPEEGLRYKIRVEEYADLMIGDVVITSGLGGIFPKGLNIGTIKSIQMDEHEIFKVAFIDLFVDFDYVEEVFVLKRKHIWQSDTATALGPNIEGLVP